MAKNDGGPVSKVTTPKEEGLKPCPFCGKEANGFGDGFEWNPPQVFTSWVSCRDENCPAFLLSGKPTQKEAIEAWNHRPATEEQGLREALEDMIETGWEYYCNYSVSLAGCDKKIARGFYQAIARAMNAALSHAPAPESERHTQ